MYTTTHNRAHSARQWPLASACRRSLMSERGAALVEFTLVLPLVMLVLFGIIEFGTGLKAANDYTNVANQVARYAAVNEDPAGKAETLAQWGTTKVKAIDKNFVSEGGHVCIKLPSGEEVGKPVEVTVSAEHN